MNSSTKIVIGLVATALLAGVAHGPLGMGKAFLAGLAGQSRAALDGAQMTDVAVKFQDAPALQRVAILSGPITDPAAREAALNAVRAIPGVHDARWAQDAIPVAVTAPPATAEAVASCQADVDAAIKGKVVQFTSGSATIDPASMELISTLAKAITACAGTHVEVAGHTDATGNPASNQTLSEARAKSVADAMVAQGVPADRVTPKGYGSTKPMIAETSRAANAANRRIEFVVASAG
jgi:OmpA-OmpF porin, OOP family